MGLGILPPPGVSPPKAPDVQDFTSSGTWNKPDGAKCVYAELMGGGSSGGTTYPGSGGNRVSHLFNAAALGATEAVGVGAGGGGQSTTIGAAGGASTFGGLSTGTSSRLNGNITPAAIAARVSDGGLASSNATSVYGAGGGTGGVGGTGVLAGMLVGGNGGTNAAGDAPGGGGDKGVGTGYDGARGAVRITTYF